MLASLFVSDLALLRRLNLDFSEGFSVLTGETGAGKSLILDAFGLFLSSKGARDLVRHGEEKLEVTAYFDSLSPETKTALSQHLSPEELEEGVSLSRVIYAQGKSLSKLNGRPLSFAQISEIAKVLFSLNGQHDSGGLLEEKNHRAYLDAALPPRDHRLLEEYHALYGEYAEEMKKLSTLISQGGDEKEKIALYDFQLQEIARVKPRAGEEEELEEKLRRLQSSEKRRAILYTAQRALSGGEKGRGAIYLLDGAARKLEQSKEEHLIKLSGELYELARRAAEMEKEVAGEMLEEDEDPSQAIDEIQKRLSALYRLKQKYGSSVEEVIARYRELKEKKDLTLSRKDDIRKGQERVKILAAALKEKASLLTQARTSLARSLEREIHGTLSFLDMPKMRFSVELTPLPSPGPEGGEKVVFAIAANTGEGTLPLSQAASGGELNRILLALRLHLGQAKDADTLIFDEIDSGISGATAQKIGICLKTLAEKKQVFCVTHSAQVSTLADHHFLVEKREENGRTQTLLTPLSPEEALSEAARLLGGKNITTEARGAAKELAAEGQREWKRLRHSFFESIS